MNHIIRPVKYLKEFRPELQYTVIATIGNRVFIRARAKDGGPVYAELEYTPTYYTPDTTGAYAGAAVSYDGIGLIPNVCDSIIDGRRFLEKQAEDGVPVYGNIQPEYMVIVNSFGLLIVHHRESHTAHHTW